MREILLFLFCICEIVFNLKQFCSCPAEEILPLRNLAGTLFPLSKYAELQRMSNTFYYPSSWEWVAWDCQDRVKGSLEE